MTVLPLVLLGLHSSFKPDLKASSAEMVYGTALRLPGEFLAPSNTSVDPLQFVGQLKEIVSNLRPTPPKATHKQSSFVSDDLHTCTHVFLRRDLVRPPLTPTYDGPFKVLKRYRKTFIIEHGKRKETVTIDRLKPAFLDEQSDVPYRTRSGREVKKRISFE